MQRFRVSRVTLVSVVLAALGDVPVQAFHASELIQQTPRSERGIGAPTQGFPDFRPDRVVEVARQVRTRLSREQPRSWREFERTTQTDFIPDGVEPFLPEFEPENIAAAVTELSASLESNPPRSWEELSERLTPFTEVLPQPLLESFITQKLAERLGGPSNPVEEDTEDRFPNPAPEGASSPETGSPETGDSPALAEMAERWVRDSVAPRFEAFPTPSLPAAGSPAPGASARSGSESGNGGRATETPAHPLNRIGRLFSRQEDFPSRSLPPAPPTPPRVNVMRDSAEQGPQLQSGTPVLSEPPVTLPAGSAPLSGGPGLVVTWTQSSPPAAPSPEAATGQAPSLATSPLAPAGISPEFPFATYSEEKPKRFRKPRPNQAPAYGTALGQAGAPDNGESWEEGPAPFGATGFSLPLSRQQIAARLAGLLQSRNAPPASDRTPRTPAALKPRPEPQVAEAVWGSFLRPRPRQAVVEMLQRRAGLSETSAYTLYYAALASAWAATLAWGGYVVQGAFSPRRRREEETDSELPPP